MTIEEAGEIILQNEPFIDCIQCNGTGRHTLGIGTALIQCLACKGRTVQLLIEYEIACVVLGLEPPFGTRRSYRDSNGLRHDDHLLAVSWHRDDQEPSK